MKTNRLRNLGLPGAAIGATTLLGASPAQAIPRDGDTAPNARIEDADGRVQELRSFRGKPTLIFYEDRDSAKQNAAFKADLAKLGRGDRYLSKVALAAVADLSAYNFWP